MSERIHYLVQRFFKQSLSIREKEELAEYIRSANDEELRQLLDGTWGNFEPADRMPEQMANKIMSSVFNVAQLSPDADPPETRITGRSKMIFRRMAAAAAIMVLVGVGYFFYSAQNRDIVATSSVPGKAAQVVEPKNRHAILTLSDGSEIILDTASNGQLAEDGNSTVVKLSNGRLAYKPNGNSSGEVLYSTMSTPRGSQYQLTLPDGSRVWLNALSSIRFPTVFSEEERRVEITGEVYFEIAKVNRAMTKTRVPFFVQINAPSRDGEIEVLGTHFNVKAYQDEDFVRTTLLEGSVKITKGVNKYLLAPGQQAQMESERLIRVEKDVNTEEVMAWKNGYFQYENTNLVAVLHDVARWYDLEIVFAGKVPTDQITGRIERSVSLPRLLKWMKWSDVNFTMEGKKMIIK